MDIQAVKAPASALSRRIVYGIVLVLDLIAVALAAVVVHNLRQIQSGEADTVQWSAISCARALIAEGVVSLGLMVALFFNTGGKKSETIIALVTVTIMSIVLVGLGAYSIHVADQLVAFNSAGAADLSLFKAAGSLQIIAGFAEIASYVISVLRTPSM